MNGQYDIEPGPSRRATVRRQGRPGGAPTGLLWVVTAVAVGLNTVFSIAGHTLISVGFGLLAICGGIGLLSRYLKGRKG